MGTSQTDALFLLKFEWQHFHKIPRNAINFKWRIRKRRSLKKMRYSLYGFIFVVYSSMTIRGPFDAVISLRDRPWCIPRVNRWTVWGDVFTCEFNLPSFAFNELNPHSRNILNTKYNLEQRLRPFWTLFFNKYDLLYQDEQLISFLYISIKSVLKIENAIISRAPYRDVIK